MSYLERNQLKQNIFAVIVGAILLAISTMVILGSNTMNDYVNNLVFPLVYLLLMLLAGMITGLIAYRKDGYKIMAILAPLTMLGHYIYLAVAFVDSTFALHFIEVVLLVIIGPGVIHAFIGCFLGVFIKYKVQKGANFTIKLLEK